MDNKPKMYRCDKVKEFHNNKTIYASYNDNNMSTFNDTNDIRKKINNIFNSSNFIYRTKVNIVIGNQILSKKIVWLYNNNLVTIDNEHIPINIINDIYK